MTHPSDRLRDMSAAELAVTLLADAVNADDAHPPAVTVLNPATTADTPATAAASTQPQTTKTQTEQDMQTGTVGVLEEMILDPLCLCGR